MTERVIMTLAKEYAGKFYEQKRSDRFRSKNSLTRAKVLVCDERSGHIVETTKVMPFFKAYPTPGHFSEAHWPLFVDAARKSMVTMLAMPDARISPTMKEAISEAIIEDRKKQLQGKAQRLIQGSV